MSQLAAMLFRPSGRRAPYGNLGPYFDTPSKLILGWQGVYRSTHSTLRGGVIRVGEDPQKSAILGPRPSSRSSRKAPQGSFGKERHVLEASYNNNLASRRLGFDAQRGTA
jgi:hypothetical protein